MHTFFLMAGPDAAESSDDADAPSQAPARRRPAVQQLSTAARAQRAPPTRTRTGPAFRTAAPGVGPGPPRYCGRRAGARSGPSACRRGALRGRARGRRCAAVGGAADGRLGRIRCPVRVGRTASGRFGAAPAHLRRPRHSRFSFLLSPLLMPTDRPRAACCTVNLSQKNTSNASSLAQEPPAMIIVFLCDQRCRKKSHGDESCLLFIVHPENRRAGRVALSSAIAVSDHNPVA